MSTVHRYSFNGGEIAPELYWRSDLKRYHNSCRQLENFIPTAYGAVKRRPPLELLAELPDYEDEEVRLLPFVYSETVQYVVLMMVAEGDSTATAYIYTRNGMLLDTVSMLYTASDLADVQYVQSADILYLVHPDYRPAQLRRNAHTDWEVRTHPINGGPWLPFNTERAQILTPELAQWDSTTEYDEGENVHNLGSADALSGAVTWEYWYTERTANFEYQYWLTVLPAAGHSFSTGDALYISDSENYDGHYRVESTTTNTISINTGVYRYRRYMELDWGTYTENWTSYYNKQAETFDGSEEAASLDGKFYECIATHTNQQPPNATYWREVDVYRGECTVRASFDFFSSDMVGGKLLLEQERDPMFVGGSFSAVDSASDALPGTGTIKLTTEGGTWGGTIELQQSNDGGTTWIAIGAIHSNDGNHNGEIERDVVETDSLVRAYMRTYDSGPCLYQLEVVNAKADCILEITAYTDANTVTCETENYLLSHAGTYNFAQGAFSPANGFPVTVAIWEERLIFGGTEHQPNTIWGSAINNWEDFHPGTLATSPINFTLAADSVEEIRWLAAKQELLVGTDAGEWTLGSRDSVEPLSGENVLAQRHTAFGSAPVQAQVTSDMILFLQRGRQKLRGMQYTYELDAYSAPDLTVLAPHVTSDSDAKELAWQRVADSILWMLREDGTIFTFTYDREQQVMGWAEVGLTNLGNSAGVLSLCVLPPDEGSGSDTVFAVARANGDTYFLTRFSYDDGPKLDFRQTFESTKAARVYPYFRWTGESAVWADETYATDSIGQLDSDFHIASGSEVFLVFDSAPSDLSITQEIWGQEQDVAIYWEWVDGTDTLVFMSLVVGTMHVYDGETELTEDTDYWSYDNDNILFVRRNDGLSSALTLCDENGDELDAKYRYSSDDHLYNLVFGQAVADVIVKRAGSALTLGTDYDLIWWSYSIYLGEAHDALYHGAVYTSLLRPTDILASPETGGPGHTTRINELDVFYVDTFGGEVSVDGGNSYIDIAWLDSDTPLGAKLDTETGRKTVRLASGYDDEADVRIRTDSLYPMTIACLGLNARRYE